MKENICEHCGGRLFDKCDKCGLKYPSGKPIKWFNIDTDEEDAEGSISINNLLCENCFREELKTKFQTYFSGNIK